VTFLFGGEKPTPPPAPAPRTKTCPDGRVVNADATCPKLDITLGVNATSQEVCQGETTAVTSALPNGANASTYTWSVNGQPVSQGPTFTFGTTDRSRACTKSRDSQRHTSTRRRRIRRSRLRVSARRNLTGKSGAGSGRKKPASDRASRATVAIRATRGIRRFGSGRSVSQGA
jgi:hypothetical protein